MRLQSTSSLSETKELMAACYEALYPQAQLHPLLMSDINPAYFHTAFFVWDDDEKVIAQAVLYLNPNLKYEGKNSAAVGNYEAIENAEVSSFLFNTIKKTAKENGADFLIGPMNGSTWDSHRFATQTTELFLSENFHHHYYIRQFAENGFEEIADYVSTRDVEMENNSPAIQKVEKRFENMGISIREINLDNWHHEMEIVYNLCITAFADNFLYTPITKEYFAAKYEKVKPIISPRYTLLAVEEDGTCAGVVFAFPNLLNKEKKELILKTLARHPDKKYMGIGQWLGDKITGRAKEDGFSSIIHAFMFEDNYSKKLSAKYHGILIKNYVLFGCDLT
ncbi:MAG: hypothetical protein NTX03_08805 [Bacteroidetes bacterium]|nr:hypothetical protein [Bacteroidota bacterium]